jgi:Domain of Unknown Function (DUF1080)
MNGVLAVLAAAGLEAAEGGWTALFDGTSTQAWRCYNQPEIPPGVWAIEEGTLKTIPGAKGSCDLITRDKYRDFELELEWKLPPGGNSGVLYRVAELPPPSQTWHSGPEMQVLDDVKHKDGLDPRTSAGALYALVAPENKKLLPPGQWNKAGVVVRGNHVEHWLNGAKILEYELKSPALQALIALSKFKDMPRFAQEAEGHIALQAHGEEVWFRNVRVRRLSGQ